MNRKWTKILAFVLIFSFLLVGVMGCGTKSAKKETPKFPTKPITLVCWSAAGSPVDVMSRELAKVLEKYLGQPVNVLTKTGGGGATGLAYTLQQPADGYTILAATISLASLFAKEGAPYSPKDIQPLAGVQADPYTVIAPPDSKFNDMKDLVKWAKENPGKLTVTGAFAGGAHHVNFSKFAKLAGFDFQWIPFEGGSEAVADVMGGHSMAGQTNPGNVKGQYEGKKLKILGVTTDKRLESLPNVPTFKELGWDYEAYHWRGIIAKKGIPDDVVKILEDALLKAVKDPQFQDYLKRTEQLSWPKTAAELGKVIQEDTDGTWEIVKALMKK